MATMPDPAANGHVLSELGFAVRRDSDGLSGSATVAPEMHAPGTTCLRTSIIATWVDTLAGLLTVDAVAPAVPVTVELDVHLYQRAPASGVVRAVARTVKQGRSVFVAGVEVSAGSGQPLATGGASFMISPDPTVRLPSRLSVDAMPTGPRLAVPLAERAGCERRAPGVAVLPRSEDGLNSSNTVNGGLIALAAEEAVLSLEPGRTLCSLGLRYLQPVRVGPLVATARVHNGLATVELRDEGADHRLSVVASARTFGS